MDLHQKISIGIFGALFLGTMAMYSSGNLSSSFINTDILDTSACTESYITKNLATYEKNRETIKELQQFVGRNCNADMLESKRPYCEAKKKQIKTYSVQIDTYEFCLPRVVR